MGPGTFTDELRRLFERDLIGQRATSHSREHIASLVQELISRMWGPWWAEKSHVNVWSNASGEYQFDVEWPGEDWVPVSVTGTKRVVRLHRVPDLSSRDGFLIAFRTDSDLSDVEIVARLIEDGYASGRLSPEASSAGVGMFLSGTRLTTVVGISAVDRS